MLFLSYRVNVRQVPKAFSRACRRKALIPMLFTIYFDLNGDLKYRMATAGLSKAITFGLTLWNLLYGH